MRVWLALGLFLAGGASVGAQDTVSLTRGPTLQGEVTAMSCTEVVVEVEAAGVRTPQRYSACEVAKVDLDTSRRPGLASAEEAFRRRTYPVAIERYERCKTDKNDPVARQAASFRIVESHLGAGDLEACAKAARALRTDQPDSFYVWASLDLEAQAHEARRDEAGLQRCIADFEALDKAKGGGKWARSVDLMRARLLELQGNWVQAVAIYRKHARDADVGEGALLGELRCVAQLKDWPTLRAKSEGILRDLASRKESRPQLLTGAYNGRGEALLNTGDPKGALWDFLRGACLLNRGEPPSREHEKALALGGRTVAQLAVSEKNAQKKEAYKIRAQELLADLRRSYPTSPMAAQVDQAIRNIQ